MSEGVQFDTLSHSIKLIIRFIDWLGLFRALVFENLTVIYLLQIGIDVVLMVVTISISKNTTKQ